MKRKILIILNDSSDLDKVNSITTTQELNIVLDVETAIEQLYKMEFDGILYQAGLEQSEEKKLLKILSLEDEPPVIHKKEAWTDWDISVEELIKSIPLKIHFVDDGFRNAALNICLN